MDARACETYGLAGGGLPYLVDRRLMGGGDVGRGSGVAGGVGFEVGVEPGRELLDGGEHVVVSAGAAQCAGQGEFLVAGGKGILIKPVPARRTYRGRSRRFVVL